MSKSVQIFYAFPVSNPIFGGGFFVFSGGFGGYPTPQPWPKIPLGYLGRAAGSELQKLTVCRKSAGNRDSERIRQSLQFAIGIKRELLHSPGPGDSPTGHDRPRQPRPRQARKTSQVKVNARSLFQNGEPHPGYDTPGCVYELTSPDAPESPRIHAQPRSYSSMVKPWKAVERHREGGEGKAGRERGALETCGGGSLAGCK